VAGSVLLDSDFELFWRKIAEAYNIVSANGSQVELEHGIYRVTVALDPDGMPDPPIKIMIYADVDVTPPTLIAP
jgi:hypothetical protein